MQQSLINSTDKKQFAFSSPVTMIWKITWVICLLVFITDVLPAQSLSDTTAISPVIEPAVNDIDTSYHSPKKAAIYSAVLPGLGQIYNKKYWKVPIVYAGMGTLVYFIGFNNSKFLEFKQAYKDFPDYKLDYDYPLTLEQIDRGMTFYKRWKDLSIIGTFGFYIFQILDATVDAHLFNWSVGEDLSLRMEPSITPPQIYKGMNTFGVRACLSF